MSTTIISASSLRVEDALRQFQREARHGKADLSRYRCAYAEWGEGPPLVLIHGLADRLQSFVLPMALLRHDFRCITYNQPIGGEDRARLRGYGHDHLVEDLFELLDQLGVHEAAVLGHSYGSTIAAKALAGLPGRMTRGVLLCGFVHRRLTRREHTLAWLARFLPGRLRHLPFRKRALALAHSWAFSHLEPERWPAFLRETESVPVAAMGGWAHQLHDTNVAEILPQISQPVLLAYGEHDALVPRTQQHEFFKRLPNAAQFEITGCGHFPMWSHPEALAEAVRRFLAPSFCHASACALEGSSNGAQPCRTQATPACSDCPMDT
jgi:pimeloyl-ACP methyl ester carboxylesterase